MDELSQDSLQIPVDESQNMAKQSPEMGGELTPEEAKASLGLSTRLSEQFLMSQVPQEEIEAPEEGQPDATETPEEAPQEEIEPKVEEEVAEEPDSDIEGMKTDIELLKKLVLEDEDARTT